MSEIIIVNVSVTLILAVLGACVASFVNVAALRRSEGVAYITGRSRCPVCGRTLRWFELIPVISWVILLGRCKTCNAKISPRYVLAELIGASAFALIFLKYRLSWMTMLSLGVAGILLTVALVDLSCKEIPNGLLFALMPFAVTAFLAQPDVSLLSRGIGLFVISAPMLILAVFIDGAFGGGDIKLMAVCGALLGWQNTLLAFFVSVITAGCLSLVMIMRNIAGKGAKIAFGPHLCTGVIAALLYGNEIISWYSGFFR